MPPPLEANDQLVTLVITGGWAVALIVVLAVRENIPADARWWIWTCVAGLVMGVFGLWYVPRMKRARARAAGRRETRDGGAQLRANGSKSVSSTDTPGTSTRS